MYTRAGSGKGKSALCGGDDVVVVAGALVEVLGEVDVVVGGETVELGSDGSDGSDGMGTEQLVSTNPLVRTSASGRRRRGRDRSVMAAVYSPCLRADSTTRYVAADALLVAADPGSQATLSTGRPAR